MDTIYVTQLDLVNYLANLHFWNMVHCWILVTCLIIGFVSVLVASGNTLKPLTCSLIVISCIITGIFTGISSHSIFNKMANPLLNYVADKTLDSDTNAGTYVNGSFISKKFEHKNYVVEYTDMYNVKIVESKNTPSVEVAPAR